MHACEFLGRGLRWGGPVGVAVPRAERSGSHRVVDVEVGDVRQVIAALAGVATLARAQGVGPRALRDSFPELRATCLAAPAIVASAILPACDVVALATGLADGARRMVDHLVTQTRNAAGSVLQAIEASERKGVGARTRLSLQGACDEAVETMARVRWAIELLQRASIGEPVPVAIDELLRELDSGTDLGGDTVQLSAHGEIQACVAVHPRVAIAVLLGAVAHAHGALKKRAYAMHARITGESVSLEFGERLLVPPGALSLSVVVPALGPCDELALELAAATMAAPMRVLGGKITLELLRA